MSVGWKYAAASVIGTSHLKSPGGECQDSHYVCCDEERDLLICAVSDGAGSASHSAIGSRLATSRAVELIRAASEDTRANSDFARTVVAEIRAGLASGAEESGLRLRDFACTLLVAIIHGPKATFWQIGDGAICFRRRDQKSFDFAFWPGKGEYANVTQFVTDENFADELEFDTSESEIVDLALFSDGLERLALDFGIGEAHTRFFTGLFPYLHAESPGRAETIEKQLADFLTSDRVNSKTDDDKTLILATTEVG